MNSIEVFLLDSGFSWTASKVAPYAIMVLLGLLLSYLLLKRIKIRFKLVKWLVALILFVAPFFIYFTISPIYEGDFSNNSVVESNELFPEINGQKLVVLSIPNCPFCHEAIGRLKKIKERVPKTQIEFIVCSSDSSTMDWYKEVGEGLITFRLAEDIESMSLLAEGHYPTFVFVNGTSRLKKWSNDNFGVNALDEIENEIHKKSEK